MTNATTPRRMRRLQTGLTVSPSSRSKRNRESSDDSDLDIDKDALTVLQDSRIHKRTADEEEKENGGERTPGKDLYSFARKRKKRFRDFVEEGRRAIEGEADEESDNDDAEPVATPSKSVKRVTVLEPGDLQPTPTRAKGRIRDMLSNTPKKTPTRGGRGAKNDEESEEQPETPVPVRLARRRRASKRLTSVKDGGSSSEDKDATDDDNEEEEDDSGLEDEHETSLKEGTDHEQDTIADEYAEDAPAYQRYFANLHDTRSKTSNNTLSKLPALDHKSLLSALARAPVKHERFITLLTSLHEDQFQQWYFELMGGFNLLFYGYGSKRNLLNRFATEVLNDAPLVVVNGFFPTLTIRDILSKIIDGVLPNHTGPVGTVQDQMNALTTYFTRRRSSKHFYLLIHNIDGVPLRAPIVQRTLSALASLPTFHVIATIDHINAPLLWDNVQSARYNWIWHDVTTFEPYMNETTFEGSLMMQQSGAGGGRTMVLDANGVMWVLRSLSGNARKVFKILCQRTLLCVERDDFPDAIDRVQGSLYY
ncbi:origin recognition complex subunit 2 [Spizellomyces punctatus DAOM BR117]|uniref:Origin recognition complex subunit 2 n=1 Tax=Spizellomyces punctatus (strain DAOM BR117) TaxID=645134 RepID=A0A0L0HVM3_SPIPD|nr:origin recognition complex subunit 2 [Spizellomyces punctatus DAOM BR117]KND05127.1 hypothetical protein SPPG_00797 [Spizellomyces punctatus DAOM BR117]|eukprot:XP_016613166.1 hypothetical protein SPPG_00797 [Spizellomyces punctatus DAOM BR117]